METETLALGIAGLVAPLITNLVKNQLGWRRHWAMALTLLVSIIVAIAAVLISGGTLSWSDPFVVLGMASVIYQFFMREA